MRQCQGCGAVLQSGEAGRPGYLPQHILENRGKALCQRCYRIRHYGRDELGPVAEKKASEAVMQAAASAEAVIMVVDLMDFEASLSWDLIRSCRHTPLIAAVNKADLLPAKTRHREVMDWIRKRFSELGITALPALVSAYTGEGVDDLRYFLEALEHRRWLVAGASNSGKSTLINGLMQHQSSGDAATVSRFPGTTQDTVSWEDCRLGRFTDSPGLIPAGRLCDMLPQEHAVAFIPDQRLQGKVYPFAAGSSMAVKGCAFAESLAAGSDTVAVGFTASNAVWQRSSCDNRSYWLEPTPGSFPGFSDFRAVELDVGAGQEVLVHGLGWLAIRRHDCRIRLTVPSGVKYTLRQNLIGGRRHGAGR